MKLIKDNNGFTLLEVFIALAILSIGLLGLEGLMLSSMQGTSFSRDETIASNLAKEEMEELKRGAINNFDSAALVDSAANSDPDQGSSPDVVEDYGTIANYGEFRRETYITDINTNLKDVAVRVVWVDRRAEGMTRNVIIRTFLAR